MNLTIAYDHMIANTFFRKRQSHLVTFSSVQHSSQIDFILTRRDDKRACVNCKVIPGECIVSQHQLLISELRFHVRHDRGAKISKRKWWRLKGDVSRVFKDRVLGEGTWNMEGEANDMWVEMTTRI